MNDQLHTALIQLKKNFDNVQTAMDAIVELLSERSQTETPVAHEDELDAERQPGGFAYVPVVSISKTHSAAYNTGRKCWRKTDQRLHLADTLFLTRSGLLVLARLREIATSFLIRSGQGEKVTNFLETEAECRKLGVVKKAWDNTQPDAMINGEPVIAFRFENGVLTPVSETQKYQAFLRVVAEDVVMGSPKDISLLQLAVDSNTVLSCLSPHANGNIHLYFESKR